MTPEEMDSPERADAVNDYVEALLAGKNPRAPRALPGGDGEALRMAALLASYEARDSVPSHTFVAGLRQRLITGSGRSPFDWRISRRGLTRGVAGAAAALAVCLFGEQALSRVARGQAVPAGWVPVAHAAELTPGTVKRFIAGDVEGHVMNIGGKIWALSAICTHKACVLNWQGQAQEFVCPCHGAIFNTSGQHLQPDEYKQTLPPLAKIPVQQLNGQIYVVLNRQ